MGFHCVDCVFGTFTLHEESGMYQGSCSRGYTLANPHVHTSPEDHFAESPRDLVPTVDPFGEEYLRTSNVCERFCRPQDAHRHIHEFGLHLPHLHLHGHGSNVSEDIQ